MKDRGYDEESGVMLISAMDDDGPRAGITWSSRRNRKPRTQALSGADPISMDAPAEVAPRTPWWRRLGAWITGPGRAAPEPPPEAPPLGDCETVQYDAISGEVAVFMEPDSGEVPVLRL